MRVQYKSTETYHGDGRTREHFVRRNGRIQGDIREGVDHCDGCARDCDGQRKVSQGVFIIIKLL